MRKDIQQDRLTSHKARELFDQVLGRHIERLIGTRHGVEALPLNLPTISWLVLLAEREREIESFPSATCERYTHETLLKGLAEIGLDLDEDLEAALQDIIQKGYIDIDGDGRFFAKKPTVSMAQLLDRAFPRMPGMNLIAYFVQTINEVQSERKDLDYAISQFDQTLQMHGFSLLIQKTHPKPDKAPKPSVKRITKLRKTEKPPISRSKPKILSSNGNLGQIEVRELSLWQDEAPGASQDMDDAIEAQESKIPEEEKEEQQAIDEKPVEFTPSSETEGSLVEPVESSESLSDISSEPSLETMSLKGETVLPNTSLADTLSIWEEPLSFQKPEEQVTDLSLNPEIEETDIKSIESNEALLTRIAPFETETIPEEHALERDDDIIEKRIVAFEQDLAMQCPICRKADIKTEQTSTGKVYYKCPNKDCNFISWGRPHHLVCPQCNNPFLVETPDRDGKAILKCPRATCHYWQRPPGEIQEEPQGKAVSQAQEQAEPALISKKPRRRVVRRRVARRKR